MLGQYGTEPIPALAIKYGACLSNGMYIVMTGLKKDSTVDVDVYRDKSMKQFLHMEHGITTNSYDPAFIVQFMEQFVPELEEQVRWEDEHYERWTNESHL